MITEQTQANVLAAEQEWQRAASRYRAQPVSAAPAISLRPPVRESKCTCDTSPGPASGMP